MSDNKDKKISKFTNKIALESIILNRMNNKNKIKITNNPNLKFIILTFITTLILSIIGSVLIVNHFMFGVKLDENQSKLTISSSNNKLVIEIPEKYELPNDRKTLYKIEKLDLLPPTTIEDEIQGLCYLYFEGNWRNIPNFNHLAPVNIGKTDIPTIKVANRSDYIAMQFYGYIKIEESGIYHFYTSSDDGSNLYINNKMVVNNDGVHGIKEKSGKIALEKGFHFITIDFFEGGGGEFLSVLYSGPGIKKQIIPHYAFYHLKSWNCPKTPAKRPNFPRCLDRKYDNDFDFTKCINENRINDNYINPYFKTY
jgi:hypothetical protein